MRPLLLATRNPEKTREFAEILGEEFAVSDLREEPDAVEVEETGSSFEENAILKVMAASRLRAGLVVADDSGLEVVALEGAPGIYSARYAGELASAARNIEKLLAALKGKQNRAARFVCAIALADNGGPLSVFHGCLEGSITETARGGGGFGYDPVFAPNGYEQTLAEIGATLKNQISHRARAIAKLRAYLQQRD